MTVPAHTNTTTAAEVPTTKDVRTGYALSKLNGQGFIDAADVLGGAAVAFDRWLAEHDREVAEKALRAAADAYTGYEDDRGGAAMVARRWLRARADAVADAPAADDEGGQER